MENPATITSTDREIEREWRERRAYARVGWGFTGAAVLGALIGMVDRYAVVPVAGLVYLGCVAVVAVVVWCAGSRIDASTWVGFVRELAERERHRRAWGAYESRVAVRARDEARRYGDGRAGPGRESE